MQNQESSVGGGELSGAAVNGPAAAAHGQHMQTWLCSEDEDEEGNCVVLAARCAACLQTGRCSSVQSKNTP